MKKTTIAIIGCGVISQIYLQNLATRFPNIRVKCCCSLRMESARKRAEQFGIGVATLEEILADAEIDMVVVLTPPATHYDIIKQALLAGKHVYTEKVLSLPTSEPARMLGIDDVTGSIESGKRADLVIWSMNPLTDFRAKVLRTMIAGKTVYKEGDEMKCYC